MGQNNCEVGEEDNRKAQGVKKVEKSPNKKNKQANIILLLVSTKKKWQGLRTQHQRQLKIPQTITQRIIWQEKQKEEQCKQLFNCFFKDKQTKHTKWQEEKRVEKQHERKRSIKIPKSKNKTACITIIKLVFLWGK